MKILFLGAGGVGGYFGGRMAQAGADITFLVRPGRAQRLAQDGLVIRSPRGDLVRPVRTVTREAPGSGYDLVVLSPKSFDFEDALESIAPVIGPETFVLPLLNGLAHMDVLDARFGANRVVGGIAQIGVMLEADGTVRHLNDLQMLTAGGRCEATRAVAEAFIALGRQAGIDANLAPDIVAALWVKWSFLASLAAGTTLFGGPVGQIVATPHGESLMRRIHQETLAVARASGKPIDAAVAERAGNQLTLKGSAFTASMFRDLRSGLQTEHEHVLGDLVRRADTLGTECVLLRAALTHLQVIAAARSA